MHTYYLTVDGGGSKLLAVLFDEDYRILATARAGGVNANFHTLEYVRAQMEAVVDALCAACPDARIARAYLTIVGPVEEFARILRAQICVDEVRVVPEALCYLLAATGNDSGAVVLAGTGQGAAYMEDGRLLLHLGGKGGLIDDEGSGFAIGRKGLMAATRMLDGWGEETALLEAAERYRAECGADSISRLVYGARDPYRTVAAFCPYVARAAEEGDAAARAILREAGEVLARLTAGLGARLPIREGTPLALCGGVLEGCRAVRETFLEEIAWRAPVFAPRLAAFQSVTGGAFLRALEEGADASAVAEAFSAFRLRHGARAE